MVKLNGPHCSMHALIFLFMSQAIRKVLLVAGGIGVYATSTYIGYQVYRISTKPEPPAGISNPKNQKCHASIYDSINDYDQKIEWDEFLMGLHSKRAEFAELCKGKVLETSAGTGRNLGFYRPEQIESLQITDSSKPMLQTGLIKLRQYKSLKDKTEFKLMDSHDLFYPDNSFDSVLDTFGLCSCEDPIQALNEIKRVVKPDGKVYLLQHGRSQHEFLDKVLDKTSEDHAQHWGCWWNRDIISLVKQSGLKIDDIKRHHFGTTYMIIASK